MMGKDILEIRLWNEQLTQTSFTNPAELVKWFGAVQSQDYPSAKWVVGQRVKGATEKAIEEAFNNGEILRTHVMRPTWHFVHPTDIRWMLQLTAPQIKPIMHYYNRILGLDEALFAKTNKIITKALEGNKQLTRTQLADVLKEHGIVAKGQRLGHIVFWAELDGVICSGPRIGRPFGKTQGKQFTYMLLEERVPKVKDKSRDEALAMLTKKYFQSHAMATMKDFSWWSGLSMLDVKKGTEMNENLLSESVDGKTYYFFETKPKPMTDQVYLLPNYDEYTIAFKQRELFYPEADVKMPKVGIATPFAHTIIHQGKIVGLYRREVKKDTVIIIPQFFKKPDAEEMREFQKAVERFGKFLSQNVVVKE